jgi:hypothetical protein
MVEVVAALAETVAQQAGDRAPVSGPVFRPGARSPGARSICGNLRETVREHRNTVDIFPIVLRYQAALDKYLQLEKERINVLFDMDEEATRAALGQGDGDQPLPF